MVEEHHHFHFSVNPQSQNVRISTLVFEVATFYVLDECLQVVEVYWGVINHMMMTTIWCCHQT